MFAQIHMQILCNLHDQGNKKRLVCYGNDDSLMACP